MPFMELVLGFNGPEECKILTHLMNDGESWYSVMDIARLFGFKREKTLLRNRVKVENRVDITYFLGDESKAKHADTTLIFEVWDDLQKHRTKQDHKITWAHVDSNDDDEEDNGSLRSSSDMPLEPARPKLRSRVHATFVNERGVLQITYGLRRPFARTFRDVFVDFIIALKDSFICAYLNRLTSIEDQRKRLRDSNDRLYNETAYLRAEKERLLQENKNLEQMELRRSLEDREERLLLLDRSHDEGTRLDSDNEHQRSEIVRLEALRDSIVSKSNRIDEQRRSLIKEMDELADRRRSIATEVKEIEEQRRSLTKDVEALTSQRRSLVAEIAEQRCNLATDIGRLEDQRQNIALETEEIEERRRNLSADIGHYEDQRQILASETETLSEQRQSIRTQREALELDTERLEERRRLLEDQRRELVLETEQFAEQRRLILEQKQRLTLEAERVDEQKRLLEQQRRDLGLEAQRVDEQKRLLEQQRRDLGLEAQRVDEQKRLLEQQRRDLGLEAQRVAEQKRVVLTRKRRRASPRDDESDSTDTDEQTDESTATAMTTRRSLDTELRLMANERGDMLTERQYMRQMLDEERAQHKRHVVNLEANMRVCVATLKEMIEQKDAQIASLLEASKNCEEDADIDVVAIDEEPESRIRAQYESHLRALKAHCYVMQKVASANRLGSSSIDSHGVYCCVNIGHVLLSASRGKRTMANDEGSLPLRRPAFLVFRGQRATADKLMKRIYSNNCRLYPPIRELLDNRTLELNEEALQRDRYVDISDEHRDYDFNEDSTRLIVPVSSEPHFHIMQTNDKVLELNGYPLKKFNRGGRSAICFSEIDDVDEVLTLVQKSLEIFTHPGSIPESMLC